MDKAKAGKRQVSRLALTLMVVAVAACAAPGDLPSASGVAVAGEAGDNITASLGSYLAGRHAQHEREYGAAALYFGRALAQDPNDYELINKTFVFDTSEGRIEEATRLAERPSCGRTSTVP